MVCACLKFKDTLRCFAFFDTFFFYLKLGPFVLGLPASPLNLLCSFPCSVSGLSVTGGVVDEPLLTRK